MKNMLFAVLPTQFRTYTHHMAFSPQVSPEVIAQIEEALKELEANGELQRLFDKYTKW
jgi:ABC-type amino acid transport substrate-binding protein